MTTNSTTDEVCTAPLCSGVTKTYEVGGVREPPEQIKKKDNKLSRRVKKLIYPLIGKEVEPLKWRECSLCHEFVRQVE